MIRRRGFIGAILSVLTLGRLKTTDASTVDDDFPPMMYISYETDPVKQAEAIKALQEFLRTNNCVRLIYAEPAHEHH